MGLNELYARWLDVATKAGFAISLCAFLVYAGGLLPAFVPLEELPRYWALPVHRFIEVTGAPPVIGPLGTYTRPPASVGAGLISQRMPYVIVRLLRIFHSS